MFRKIRRVKNELDLDAGKKLLANNKRGVISFNGDNDYPYSIPINYLYDVEENNLYFHGSKVGYKVDCIKNNNKSCFVTYGDEELSDNGWSYYLKSVVVFGKIEIVEDRELAAKKLRELAAKYYPSLSEVDAVMERSFDNALVYYLDVAHMTCKKVHEK